MKKLMLICSVTFMFLLLGSSASAQNANQEALQKIKAHLQELPSTTLSTLSSEDAFGDTHVSKSKAATLPTNRVERKLFRLLAKTIKNGTSPIDAIDVVVDSHKRPGQTKASLVDFKQKALELLNN